MRAPALTIAVLLLLPCAAFADPGAVAFEAPEGWTCTASSTTHGGLSEHTTTCVSAAEPTLRARARHYQVRAERAETADEVAAVFQRVYTRTLSGVSIADPEPVERNGWSGTLLRWSGKRDGERLRGADRIFVADDEVILVAVEAAPDVWEREGRTIGSWLDSVGLPAR